MNTTDRTMPAGHPPMTLAGAVLGRHRRRLDALDIEDRRNGQDARTRATCDLRNAHRVCPMHSPAGYAALGARHARQLHDPTALPHPFTPIDRAEAGRHR